MISLSALHYDYYVNCLFCCVRLSLHVGESAEKPAEKPKGESVGQNQQQIDAHEYESEYELVE